MNPLKGGPDDFERISYYNGIAANGDHPDLLYRSNSSTTPFQTPRPTTRFGHIPNKSLRGVFDTSLNPVWPTVGPQICNILKTHNIRWVSIDPARFFTHEEDEQGCLGPPVIWVGVQPGSTTSHSAHEVSQEILAILLQNGVQDVVIEWRETVLQRLVGPPLMPHVITYDPTHHLRRFLTPLLGVPLATQGMEEEEGAQGTLTLWFHENKDNKGNQSKKVYGVTNCHVLRKNTHDEYQHESSTPKDCVQVCGARRFQRGLDEIQQAIDDHRKLVERFKKDVAVMEKESCDENAKLLVGLKSNIEQKEGVIVDLQAFYEEVKRGWSNDRNIGHVEYAAPITVDVEGGTLFTSDWAVFSAAEEKIKDNFQGNVVDLGSKYSQEELTAMFNPRGDEATSFKYPQWRKLQIVGCGTNEEITNPAQRDHNNEPCLIVGKDGNTTDLTVGCFAGLESFSNNDGTVSRELAVYGVQKSQPFSQKGDSGSLVWFLKDEKAYILGQLHSGHYKGGSTTNYVTYCTPGWYLLDQIKKKYKYADFYRTKWSESA
ncbi:hypothetical protein H0H93_013642 [Arthromyces matolae]|nr:hypothetical protein H0H93_013642 [Arthromyces matolae]